MNQQAIYEQEQRNDADYPDIESEPVSWLELWTEKLLQDPDTVTDGIWFPRYPKAPLYESKAAQLEYDANQLITLRNLFRKTYESNGQDTESCAMIGQIFSDNYANYVDKVAAKSAGVR